MIPEHELRQMYHNEEMTQKEIAKEISVSNATVCNWMKSYGIQSRTISESQIGNLVKPSKEDFIEMYLNNNMSIIEIAEEISVGVSTIFRWMKEYDIKLRTHSESMLKNISKPSEKELEEMYMYKKMSQSEIAKSIGVSQGTVGDWMKKYDIESRTDSESLVGKFGGENSWNWKGGISFEPYCKKFNNSFREAVRERDNHTCQLCGFEQNGRRLSVHHIHYDKTDCWPDVVTLCNPCNSKVNSNRDYWEKYFENQLAERGLTCWSISQET